MHVTKYTRGTLGHMLGHYDRTKDGLGENVVPERTQLNYNLAVDDQPFSIIIFPNEIRFQYLYQKVNITFFLQPMAYITLK